MRRSGDGIDRIADERGEPHRPSGHFKDEEQKRKAECLPRRTGNSLKRKHTWSREEDDNLIRMVNLYGSNKSWSTVARGMPGRSPIQCRERWMFYVDPAVNNQPWSEQEDIALIQAHKIHGSKWCRLAKLFPGRTGKAVRNHWSSLMMKQMKSDLVRGLPEQFPLVTKNKGSSTIKSCQDSSTNIHASPDLMIRSKSEQGSTQNGRNGSILKGKGYDSTHGKGSASHSVNVSENVAAQIGRYNSPSSVDQKDSSTTASFPAGSLPKEETTNFREVTRNRRFSPANNHISNNDHFDDFCGSADPDSQELHQSNIADLLDMSYCESLLIVPPESPNHGNSTDGM